MYSRRLKQLLALSLDDWKIVLHSLVLLPLIALKMRRSGFLATRNWVQTKHGQPLLYKRLAYKATPMQTIAQAQRVAKLVAVAARFGVYRASCIKQSLVCCLLLRQQAIDVEVVIGSPIVPSPGFAAHAWIELNGEAIGFDNKSLYDCFRAPSY